MLEPFGTMTVRENIETGLVVTGKENIPDEIFSLFPSTTTDIFGPKYATTNTALMYTAKGVSAFGAPLANVLKTYTGSWHSVFVVASIMNLIVVAMALFVIRPMRLSISAAEKQNAMAQAAE